MLVRGSVAFLSFSKACLKVSGFGKNELLPRRPWELMGMDPYYKMGYICSRRRSKIQESLHEGLSNFLVFKL
jgi:hypothetical protein